MNIASKLTVGLVSIAFIVSVAVAFSATVHAQESVEDLQAQLAALTAQLTALSGATTPPATVAAAGSNAACPYTWARNLSIGSSGDDVRQLQRFLNGNPQTQVASSGAGSPGNETTYYGPATARAVSKFQELHSAQILAPIGLTSGTGGFYTSTRNQANNVCGTAQPTTNLPSVPVAPTTPTTRVSITGGSLAVTAGQQPGDSYAVQGAQRVPFTSFVLTAGNEDVRIEGIRVRRFGLSSRSNFESVALVDVNGVQIGSSRSLNSRDEATLGGNFVIPRNRSITLVVVGNITNTSNDLDSGAIAGLEVSEVIADAAVQGQFPVRGAAHVMSSSVQLQTASVRVKSVESDVHLDEDTEVASVRISLGGANADEEDAYLRSLTLEQNGSADEDEIGDVTVYVDDDEVDHDITVDGDRYVITFGGRGALIEESDSITVSVEMNTDRGTDETIRFYLDDVVDVYVVGKDYGYGLPVSLGNNADQIMDHSNEEGSVATIQPGEVSSGGRIRGFEDEVVYGDDRVLGALEVEFEGEDVEMEDLTFDVELSGFRYDDRDDNDWEDADEDEVVLRGLHLRVDGEKVAFADDDVEFSEPTSDSAITETVDFSDTFTVDVRGEREVVFEVVADLDEAWGQFDGADLQFTLTDVDSAEGVRSEKDYAGTGEYFASSRAFEQVDIKGNVVEFSISDRDVDDDSFVAGADDIVFGTLEIDANDAVDDVEVTSAYLTFEASGGESVSGGNDNPAMLDDLNDCAIYDGDDKVADSRSSLTGTVNLGSDNKVGGGDDTAAEDQIRFRFDDYTVDSGEEVDLQVVCSIDDDAKSGYNFQLKTKVRTSDKDRIEYEIGRDDFEYDLRSGDSSDKIAVSGMGTLSIETDNPDEDNPLVVVAVGNSGKDDVEILDIEFEAEQEDAVIRDVYLSDLTLPAGSSIPVNRENIERLLQNAELTIGSSTTTARARDFTDSKTVGPAGGTVDLTDALEFEDVNETIEVTDGEVDATISLDLRGIDDNSGKAGQYLQAAKLVVVWEGDESDTEVVTEHDITAGKVTSAVAFPTVPTVSASDRSQDFSNGGNQKLYEFTVAADDAGDVYLGQVALTFTGAHSRLGSTVNIRRGTSSSSRVVASGSPASGTVKFPFTNVETVDSGESVTFSVTATVSGVADNESITIELADDSEPAAADRVGQELTDAKAAFNFVWSPNSLDNDGATSSNADWFSGWAVFDDDDVEDWTSDEDN